MSIRLFILQTDIQGKDIRVFYSLRHIRVSGAMIQDESTNELRIGCSAMLHFHDFNHVEVNGRSELLLRFYNEKVNISGGDIFIKDKFDLVKVF